MAGDDPSAVSGVQPGAVTLLLESLAKAPSDELGGAWPAALREGAVVGRFELVREIGRGGFGVVWEAKDRELGRHVAFKAVRAGRDASATEERLLLEAEAAARLAHPNIVALYDIGRSEHGPFLVFELLRGVTLAERLAQSALPPHDALRIAVDVARALAHAHESGVTHRDLKPANVFLCHDGTVRVLDFGLSQAFGRRRTSGGTPAYMAPEQRDGAPEDERSDVYALGVTLYEMLAGQRPPMDRRGAPMLALDVPDTPGVGDVVARMLAPRAVDRPRDGGAVLELLLPLLRSLEALPDASRPVIVRRNPRSRGRRWAFAAVAAALLALSAVVAFRGRTGRRAEERPLVAVADFVNETRDPELDGLSGLLTTSLQQSSHLRVLTRGRMLDLLRSAGDASAERLDEPHARDAARRAGVRALVLTSIRRINDVYVVDAQVLDPSRDEYLFAATERAAGKGSVLALVDRVSERTRIALHENLDAVRHASMRVSEVAPDLEAYQSYFLGKACVERFVTATAAAAECLPHLERAVAKDPGLAIAWLQIAGVRMWLDRPLAATAIDAAIRSIERAPPRERVQIRALAAHIADREDEAAALFREAAAASPDDRTIQLYAADFFLTRGDLEASLPYWWRGVELDPPPETVSAFYLAKALGALRRTKELEKLGALLARAEPAPAVLTALCRVRAALGDGEAAADAARRAGNGGELALLWLHGRVPELEPAAREAIERRSGLRVLDLVLHGRFREALALRGADGMPVGDLIERGRLAAASGQLHDARIAARAATADDARQYQATLSVDLALAGDLALAEEAARALVPGSPRERTYRAVALWKRGAPEAALPLVDRLVRESPWMPHPGTMRAHVLRAALLSELGRDAEALEALDHYGAIYDPGIDGALHRPRALLLRARSHERLGQREAARSAVAALLELWKDADADLPLLAEARELSRRIGGNDAARQGERMR